MKILIIAPYIYDKNLKEFNRNETGFGIMVKNITKSIGKITETFLMTRVITREKKLKNYKILSHTWKDVFLNSSFESWVKGIYIFCTEKVTLKDKLRFVFYKLDEGYIEKFIRKVNPDIVHIHGIGRITENYINICNKLKIKYIVTLHGLIGLDKSVSASSYDKNLEKNFLIKAYKENIPVTVISSGIKKRIEKNYLFDKNAYNIKIILNGTDIQKKISENLNFNTEKNFEKKLFLEKYKKNLREGKFPELEETYQYIKDCKINNKKIIFSIGNITFNKNQIELIKVFLKMNREDICVIFWGNERDQGSVRKNIIENNLEENIILAGFCDILNYFWKLADLNILLSLNEGFGLSIIEGYNYGVPSVTFADLDAAEDIFKEGVCNLIKKRNCEEIINTIETSLTNIWNKEKIVEFGRKFSMENIAKDYYKIYSEILEE